MINTDDLRFIATIASHKTLADVARALNITPPSVTLRVKHIEKKLSVTLIQRPSRTVVLTEEGHMLLERGRPILEELDNLQEQLDERKQHICGTLRVLAPLGFGNDYVAPLLAQYKQQHPQLKVELELSDKPSWSNHHKWDVVIYIGALKDSSLKMITLAKNRRFICASPDYINKRGKPSSPQQLLNHDCLALRENNEDVTLWSFVNDNNDKQDLVRINPVLACNEGRVIKEWAKDGLGIVMRSEWDVLPQINSGELVRLLDDYHLPDADIVALLSSPEKERSARVSGFIDLLKQVLEPRPWESCRTPV
ncbi:LysR substrate-binding domain-containing protein [Vibrio sp. 99-8-1]|uniref:LysR substrate-binding domain-containing protein n=1 Tax=Vibrio sp. 99-8-1 TaxID=2607602 RepID=UPI0014938AF5|nr:LysR substrate-binding domain-containing protein [Vibrio sp. 99-8-1]NOI65733.1 LysR family transcriptional regulator [Vibrio sp. 99-8-1]